MNPKYSGTIPVKSDHTLKREYQSGRFNQNKYQTLDRNSGSPFVGVPKQLLQSHHERAMNDLAVIANDLEKCNNNRYFNERARSMLLPE